MPAYFSEENGSYFSNLASILKKLSLVQSFLKSYFIVILYLLLWECSSSFTWIFKGNSFQVYFFSSYNLLYLANSYIYTNQALPSLPRAKFMCLISLSVCCGRFLSFFISSASLSIIQTLPIFKEPSPHPSSPHLIIYPWQNVPSNPGLTAPISLH